MEYFFSFFFSFFYLLKILEPTQGLPGALQASPGLCRGVGAVQGCAFTRISASRLCPSVRTTKGRLNASPTEQAGSRNLRQQPGWPIVGKGCLSRHKKGTEGQDDTSGRGRHICKKQKLLSHYRADSRQQRAGGVCVRACARPARLTLSCPARRSSARHSYKDIDFPLFLSRARSDELPE